MNKPKIYFFTSSGACVGRTTEYFDCVEIQELMRQWSLAFSVTNENPMRQYIQRGAVYEIHGQKFDHKRMKRNSGTGNTTSVEMAYHVCRRLESYTLTAGYTCTGTAAHIISDILGKAVDSNGNKASTQFSLGTCVDVSGAYTPSSTGSITAYAAIQGLVALGVEPQFDNFTVNAPVRWGADRGMTFKFGRNLADLDFEDDAEQNTTTYTPDAVNRQYALNATDRDYIETGDTVRIKNDLLGEDIRAQRVCTLETHWDDHTGDKFTVGQFVLDLADTITSVQTATDDTATNAKLAISTAQSAAQSATSSATDAQKAQESAAQSAQTVSDLSSSWQTDLAGKVDKITGKGLSTNDYDNTDKATVDGIPAALALKVALASTQDSLSIPVAKTPASATATGTKGMWCWDAGYLYVCVDTNTWKRAALTAW